MTLINKIYELTSWQEPPVVQEKVPDLSEEEGSLASSPLSPPPDASSKNPEEKDQPSLEVLVKALNNPKINLEKRLALADYLAYLGPGHEIFKDLPIEFWRAGLEKTYSPEMQSLSRSHYLEKVRQIPTLPLLKAEETTLIKLLKHPDPEVRQETVQALNDLLYEKKHNVASYGPIRTWVSRLLTSLEIEAPSQELANFYASARTQHHNKVTGLVLANLESSFIFFGGDDQADTTRMENPIPLSISPGLHWRRFDFLLNFGLGLTVRGSVAAERRYSGSGLFMARNTRKTRRSYRAALGFLMNVSVIPDLNQRHQAYLTAGLKVFSPSLVDREEAPKLKAFISVYPIGVGLKTFLKQQLISYGQLSPTISCYFDGGPCGWGVSVSGALGRKSTFH